LVGFWVALSRHEARAPAGFPNTAPTALNATPIKSFAGGDRLDLRSATTGATSAF